MLDTFVTTPGSTVTLQGSKQFVGTPGKELLVADDPPFWWIKVITAHAYQLAFTGFLDDHTWFLERDWNGWYGSGPYTPASWQDKINSTGGDPVPGSGDTRGATPSHYFDSLSPSMPTSNTHTTDGVVTPGPTTIDLVTSLPVSAPYGRAVTRAFAHDWSEFYWQDGLEITERAYFCSAFVNTDTTDSAAVAAASSVPPPWDFTDYQVYTDNGLTSDGSGQMGVPSTVVGGWISTPIDNTRGFVYTRGKFKVDRPTYYFIYSQGIWDMPFTADPLGALYFRQDGIAVPGTDYVVPGPYWTPFAAALPSPPSGYTGQQNGENMFVVFSQSPENYAASLGLTWTGNPFVIIGH